MSQNSSKYRIRPIGVGTYVVEFYYGPHTGWTRLRDYRTGSINRGAFTFAEANAFVEYRKKFDEKIEESRQKDAEFIKNNPTIYV